MRASQHDSPTSAPSQHADPYLIDAERAARRAHNGEDQPLRPACNVTPAGLRIVAAIDLPIGSRIKTVWKYPVTLIGVTDHHVVVRNDEGEIEVIEHCELVGAFMQDDEAFNQCVPVLELDSLNRLGHLLAELQMLNPADPDDDIDEQTIADAQAMRLRIGHRIAEVCAKNFSHIRSGGVR